MLLDPFDVQVVAGRDRALVRLAGQVTIDAEEALAHAFRSIDLASRPAIDVDFGSVLHVNSSGITALLGALACLRERAGPIAFTGVSRELAKLFRMTGFDALVRLD
jgi:anti-anti-sigma factor